MYKNEISVSTVTLPLSLTEPKLFLELEEIDSALTKKIPDTKTCCRNKHLNSNASYYTTSDKKSRPIHEP